uniref:Uncharacterized protein n=1 Tax=Ananas comosus var. bracteatus TaxID=296719 RepID=A0A6V7PW24_ANACO|nr:unnamed protein product [Ananas comosus var. bracteatus]
MVDAERQLLANALLDPSNCRFVLLSDSCIPLFNFSAVHGYLAGSHLSFVSSFDDPGSAGRGRYKSRMRPTVSLAEWRKGSQWFAVHRELAVGIVSDRRYYPVFREHCRPPCYATSTTYRRWSPSSFRRATPTGASRGSTGPAVGPPGGVSASGRVRRVAAEDAGRVDDVALFVQREGDLRLLLVREEVRRERPRAFDAHGASLVRVLSLSCLFIKVPFSSEIMNMQINFFTMFARMFDVSALQPLMLMALILLGF